MVWLEIWRDSWSTGSVTASSSSSAGGANVNNDARAATTENGKKRKQEVATAAAAPSDEPRRTKRARKPTAALAEFRIELDSRQDRNDANDFEQPRVTRKRVRVDSGEDAASSLELRTGGQIGQGGQAAFSTPLPIASTPAQQPAAMTAPLPPYTVEDDTIILRMYLQSNSAERIGIAIKRSAFSVHRGWTKKKDGWIAAGLLTAGSRPKLHDNPPDPPVVSAATTSPGDPFADLRVPPTTETTESDLGGFDASFFSYEDTIVDPALLGVRAEPMSDAAGGATILQSQNPAATTLASRQESALVASASEDDSSMPETTTEKMLIGAMPHYDSGMQGLNRFLRLVKDGGGKKRARKWTVAELHAHCRRKAADKKRLRAEETSERLKALYAVAPRIGPDGKPLPPANHTKRDGAKTGPQAMRSRPSRAMAPPTSTPPPPDQAPATPTAAAGKVRSNQLQDQPVVSATTARPLDFVADLRTSSTSTAIAQQDQQVSTGSSASTSPLPGTAESHLGGFDASFSNDNISPTLTGIEAGSGFGSATEVPPPKPQMQDTAQKSVAASLGSRRDSSHIPSAPEPDSSTLLRTAEDMLAGAMPHYDSGMQGLNRFLRLVRDGRKKKR
ncbi:hypothetical protein RHOSPDRAFT_36012 [Rhodotorula sp. JG-1b]|nr:hypothetical protein RHOSPDRAFT_36012 [Rhodotorula sp. JG-1b]